MDILFKANNTLANALVWCRFIWRQHKRHAANGCSELRGDDAVQVAGTGCKSRWRWHGDKTNRINCHFNCVLIYVFATINHGTNLCRLIVSEIAKREEHTCTCEMLWFRRLNAKAHRLMGMGYLSNVVNKGTDFRGVGTDLKFTIGHERGNLFIHL